MSTDSAPDPVTDEKNKGYVKNQKFKDWLQKIGSSEEENLGSCACNIEELLIENAKKNEFKKIIEDDEDVIISLKKKNKYLDKQLEKMKLKVNEIQFNSKRKEYDIIGFPKTFKEYNYDYFISYRVKFDASPANELFFLLTFGWDPSKLPKPKTKTVRRVFLDTYKLKDGENFTDGFLHGLKKSMAIILLVSNAAIDGFRDADVQWETALLAADQGLCIVIPVFVASAEGKQFDLSKVLHDLDDDVFPNEPFDTNNDNKCQMSASTTLRLLFRHQGIFVDRQEQLRSIVPRIMNKLEKFKKEYPHDDIDRKEVLFKNKFYGQVWDSEICDIKANSDNVKDLFKEFIPFNNFWKHIKFQVKDDSIEGLIKGFEDCENFEKSSLLEITFYGESFNDKDMSRIIRNLSKNLKIRFQFKNGNMFTKTAKALCERNGTEEVYANEHCIYPLSKSLTCGGSFTLISVLAVSEVYKFDIINLSFKSIGTNGITKLAEFISNPQKSSVFETVTTINLESNDIKDVGATHLGNALSSNETVKFLKLGKNKIGHEGAKNL
ncbi:hypothetical protein HK096_005650, partial [Nowakowskiella sp. JEL0078]